MVNSLRTMNSGKFFTEHFIELQKNVSKKKMPEPSQLRILIEENKKLWKYVEQLETELGKWQLISKIPFVFTRFKARSKNEGFSKMLMWLKHMSLDSYAEIYASDLEYIDQKLKAEESKRKRMTLDK